MSTEKPMPTMDTTTAELVRAAVRDALAAVEGRARQRFEFPDEEGRIGIVAEAAIDFVIKGAPLIEQHISRADLIELALDEVRALGN